ncbi:hypothetical protein N0V85_006501 [Neurospora sp. IMI 360204]|nr:hypothetical protein N0V85_006501 [Neurospora sp. IMI 360204]
MSSFLWSSGFGVHKYRLSLPTIADVMDIADCAFARTLSILEAIDEAHNIKTTFSLDVANETIKDAEPIHAVEKSASVNNPLPASPIEENEPLVSIARDHDDFPTSPSSAEVRVYSHVPRIVDIVEINCPSAPINVPECDEYLGAFASSVNYNDFERFLDEDRMWGVHRPATGNPLILSSKVVKKKQVVPIVKSDKKKGKEVAAGASAAITNAPEGAVDTCSSSDLLQPVTDDIISQRARKASTDTYVSTKTFHTVDPDKSTDTVPTTTNTVSSCPEATPKPDCDSQPPTIPEIILTEPSEIFPENADDIKSTLESDSGIPTRESLPSFSGLYDYTPLNFTQEDLDILWIMTILKRPGYPVEYAKLNCGFWYIIEDKKNMRMMVEHEYEEFLKWIGDVDAAGTTANQKNEPEVNEPQVNEPENSNGLEILEEYPKEDDDIAQEEEEEEDWAELLRWKKRYELGRGWGVVKSFNHPDYADRKYALANDNRWYFEYKGKYRRLLEDEMDLLNRRREDGSALVDAIEEQSVTSRWGLANIAEEEEEE